jgi:RimJ/RimL family protein N-acetyltransferase
MSTTTIQTESGPTFPDLTRDDVFRLETPRLWLRWQRHADAPAVRAFAGLREVAEMTGTWAHPLPEGEPERRIFESRKANATGQSLILAMTLRGRPNLQIGTIALVASQKPGPACDIELGYMLHPEHWGQGLMAEAAQAMLSTGFSYTSMTRVRARVRVINTGSRRVLEKCGFQHVGSALLDQPARGGMVHCDEFMLERKTWSALVGWATSQPVAEASRLLPPPAGGIGRPAESGPSRLAAVACE